MDSFQTRAKVHLKQTLVPLFDFQSPKDFFIRGFFFLRVRAAFKSHPIFFRATHVEGSISTTAATILFIYFFKTTKQDLSLGKPSLLCFLFSLFFFACFGEQNWKTFNVASYGLKTLTRPIWGPQFNNPPFPITPATLALIVLRSSACWIRQQLDKRSVVEPTWLPSSNCEASLHGHERLKNERQESG